MKATVISGLGLVTQYNGQALPIPVIETGLSPTPVLVGHGTTPAANRASLRP